MAVITGSLSSVSHDTLHLLAAVAAAGLMSSLRRLKSQDLQVELNGVEDTYYISLR